MVLITLVVAGVGLALEKREKRNAARSLQQEQAAEELRKQREEEAFAELQSYANFQTSLSSKVLGDLESENASELEPPPRYSFAMSNQPLGYDSEFLMPSTEATYPSDDEMKRQPFSPSPTGFDFPFAQDDVKRSPFLPPSDYHLSPVPTRTKAVLSAPFIIPQETAQTGARCWSRAYTPSLMSCNISQSSFLDFLDSFNDFLKTSPLIHAINIASLTSRRDSVSNHSLNLSATIPLAVHEAKRVSAENGNVFLHHANDALFIPNGLFAMVVSSQPDQMASVLSVNCNDTLSSEDQNPDLLSTNGLGQVDANIDPALTSLSTDTGVSANKLREIHSFTSRSPSWLSPPQPETQSQSEQPLSFSPPTPTPSQQPSTGNKALASYTLHSFVNTVSAAHERRRDSRRQRKRRNMHIPSRIEKRPGSVCSFASSMSARSGSSFERTRVDDGDVGSVWGILPGALYIVIVNDPDCE